MNADGMGPIVDRLIYIDVAVTNFQIESAIRICANPGLILNSSSLTAEIRQRNQVPSLAFLTFREIVIRFQRSTSLPACLMLMQYTTKNKLLARGL